MGLLPRDGRPSLGQLLALPGCGAFPPREAGRIGRVGRDDGRHEVCFLSSRARFDVLERALRQVGRELGLSTVDVVHVDAMPSTSLLSRVGGCAGRWSGRLGGPGRRLAARSVRTIYPGLVDLVRRTREALTTGAKRDPREDPGTGAKTPGQMPRGGTKVFYYCYGSSHTSVVAAAIHTGRLDLERVPTIAELTSLRHFDRVRSAELGTVFPAGLGPDGERVYVVGLGPGRKIIHQTILSFLELQQVPPREYLFADALSRANWVVRAGGLASRRLGLVALGRPLAALGIQMVYPRLASLVAETRAEVGRRLGLTGVSGGG